MAASTSRHPLCSICSSLPSKYTCPGCSCKTCSLSCTKQHKINDGCSGLRDRTEYVGMDRYGDIGMWRDLGYLREVKEKVGEWGKSTTPSIPKSANDKRRNGPANIVNGHGNKGKGREREQNPTATATVPDRVLHLSDKELRLKRQLASKGIEILFLPSEMERHVQNLSNYNQKKKKLHLTVSVSVCDGDTREKVYTHTTHYNELSTTLQSLVKATLDSNKDLNLSLEEATSRYTLLLSAPVRPTTYIPRNAEPIIPAKQPAEGQKPSKIPDKPLPVPHSSLPTRPDWVPELLEEVEVEPEQEEVKPVIVEKPAPAQPAKRVWQISLESSANTTLEQALRGTSVLEWPELELWPVDLVKRELQTGKLELAERRGVFERGKGWGNKRKVEEVDPVPEMDQEPEELGADAMKRRLVEEVAAAQDAESDSDSDSDSSDTSSSSSSDDSV